MFERPTPRWFSISADRPFVEDLARGLSAEISALNPDAAAEVVVLLPTRRGARALAEAFAAQADRPAVLLPQIRALGDLEENEPPFEPGTVALQLPAAIDGRRRRFELARLVHGAQATLGRSLDAASALEFADALAGFLDSCHLEGVSAAGRIDGLADVELARHWQVSADFLRIAVDAWPERLEALGLIDAADRRVRLLRALAEQWRRDPPSGMLVAAGSTGSTPATADLLATVAAAPRGAVVLPGLDHELSDEAWAQVGGGDGEQHPQGAMKRLLERAGVARAHVRPWPGSQARGPGWARRRVVNEALRPAEATSDWLETIDTLRAESDDVFAEGLRGLSLVVARTEEEAATAAALLLREALEVPGRTAALVTPDRALARRVSARLTRWNVEADSSAGAPLAGFPVGVLVALTAALAADPAEPVTLLGVLKHPLVRLGLAGDVRRRSARAFERRVLRTARPRDWAEIEGRAAARTPDPRPEETPEALAARAEADREEAERAAPVAAALGAAVRGWAAVFGAGPTSVGDAARAHVQALETLATDPRGQVRRLWAGPEGELAAGLFGALLDGAEAMPPVDAAGYAALISALLGGETVRNGAATHPRLRILGAIEARLVRADRMILAGLEEGVWPAAAATDPLLSRPMRETLGLPPPERRVGLSAHDFAQAACAPEVVLLRSERRGGAPTVASRWLWRLQTLAAGAGTPLRPREDVLAWARALDAPARFDPAPRPKPKPPLEDRPRQMSVTRIETWVRNPYETYAREILDLRPLDPPDAPLEASKRGTAVHAALERFAHAFDDTPPDEQPALFERLLNAALAEEGLAEHARAREAALARNGAQWISAWERERRAGSSQFIERSGALTLDVDGRPFRLTAKADRIEVRNEGADILDFKTGGAATGADVRSGFSPQLTLTAAIVEGGGFDEVPAAPPRELAYVRLTCRRPPGKEIVPLKPGEAPGETVKAREGLIRKVAEFDELDTPYTAWVAPKYRSEYGKYDHLARVWEWAVIGADEIDGAVPVTA